MTATATRRFAGGLIVSTLTLLMGTTSVRAGQRDGANEYYDTLLKLPSFWKGYALRTQAEIDEYKQVKTREYVTYDPVFDALKATIPVIRASAAAPLLSNISATDTVIPLDKPNRWDSAVIDKGLIKIDDEIMLVASVDTAAKLARVSNRGYLGTRAAPHAAGADVYPGTNSLQNQIRVPLGTSDGHKYLITWDVYWTRSWVKSGVGMKAFQLSSGGKNGDTIWLETQLNTAVRYSPGLNLDTDPGGATLRSYNVLAGAADWAATDGNHLGPVVTKADIIQPEASPFVVKADRWTRYWIYIDQRANDYDYVDFWVADSRTGPTHVYSHIPVSVRTTGAAANQIVKWWIELNTSQDRFVRGDARDLVTYVRNLVVLRDPGDVPSLLRKPAK